MKINIQSFELSLTDVLMRLRHGSTEILCVSVILWQGIMPLHGMDLADVSN